MLTQTNGPRVLLAVATLTLLPTCFLIPSDECKFNSCDCRDFDYTCADWEKELSQTFDDAGRVKTQVISYPNHHRVTCNYFYDSTGECELAVCRDEGGVECRWEPTHLLPCLARLSLPHRR